MTPWTGGSVGALAECVLAPNPGPMTLDGTNTWVLSAPGAARAVVVDPGPLHEAHLATVLAAAEARGARVAQVLLTHGHADHSEGAARFAELAGGVPVRALDPAFRLGDEGLTGGDVVDVGGLLLEVVATPGHTDDCLSFLLPEAGAVLTGDMVLGRGTTVVAYPEGRLDDYLGSIRLLRDEAAERGLTGVWPGHGPVLDRPADVLDGYLAHREQRLEQVRDAVESGARTPQAVVETVYAGVDRAVWPAAELSVRAQLTYLGVPFS